MVLNHHVLTRKRAFKIKTRLLCLHQSQSPSRIFSIAAADLTATEQRRIKFEEGRKSCQQSNLKPQGTGGSNISRNRQSFI